MAFTGYTNGGFDMLSRGLGMLGQDVQNYQKQQQLADLGQSLKSGNLDEAAQKAWAIDPNLGLKLTTLGLQQKASAGAAPVLGMPLEYPGETSPATPSASAPSTPGNNTYTGGLLPAQTAAGMDPNNMDPASPIIGSMENAGKGYAALGPVTDSGDRAYGMHQVMGSNVGPWTKEVLGKEMTPQEFLGNPFAQERIFAVKFGQYRQKYGDDQTAAQAWFAGPKGVGTNRSDGNATVPEYAAEFAARNQTPPQVVSAPSGDSQDGGSQVASADNSFAPQSPGAVASDESALLAKKKTYFKNAQSAIIRQMAQPLLDEGTRSALKANLDIVSKNLADIKSEEDKAVTTLSPAEFKAKFPDQQYPSGGVPWVDAAGKPGVTRFDNERVPNEAAKVQQRHQVLEQHPEWGIDPNSAQGQDYILNGKAPELGAMKATEQKMYSDSTNKVLTLQQSIDQLKQARQLNDTAYSGNYQPNAAAWAHRNLPSGVGDLIADPKRVAATTQFTNLVTSANASLGKDIFGSRVTNYDEQLLQKMKAGDFMAPDERTLLLDQAIAMRQEALAKAQSDIAQMKAGTRFQRAPTGQPQGQPQSAQPPQGQQAQPPQGARQASDGNYYLPDPSRPGKYLMWQP